MDSGSPERKDPTATERQGWNVSIQAFFLSILGTLVVTFVTTMALLGNYRVHCNDELRHPTPDVLDKRIKGHVAAGMVPIDLRLSEIEKKIDKILEGKR